MTKKKKQLEKQRKIRLDNNKKWNSLEEKRKNLDN